MGLFDKLKNSAELLNTLDSLKDNKDLMANLGNLANSKEVAGILANAKNNPALQGLVASTAEALKDKKLSDAEKKHLTDQLLAAVKGLKK